MGICPLLILKPVRAGTVFGTNVELGSLHGKVTQCPAHAPSLFLSASTKLFDEEVEDSNACL